MADRGPINLHTLRFLQSDAGTDLLEKLKSADLSDANTLRLLTNLRKRYPSDLAAAALETARLRIKAREKFLQHPEQLFLTSEGLEQATHQAVASLHLLYLRGFGRVADLGCGIGGDTRIFRMLYEVVAVDRDLLRLQLARANGPLVELSNRLPTHFIEADLTDPLPFTGVKAAFFDPARRSQGKRVFSIRDYTPPLDIIRTWNFDALAVKLSPGIDLAELAPYQGSVEFVSVDGDLKEALWLGGTLNRGVVAATVLTVHNEARLPDFRYVKHNGQIIGQNLSPPPLREPRGYLYEPDPAVIRAGLLGELAERLAIPMYRLDETIAYLTADSLVQTRLARAWIIDDWMPFNLKKLRAYLRERSVGRVTVKKRGSPLTPEELIARLKLPGGGQERVVVLTHVLGNPAVLICRTLDQAT